MSRIILFNKPYGVLTQFTDKENRRTLKEFIKEKNYYPAGRLDKDSEGLLILTNSGKIQHEISDPKHKTNKTYWVQIEGIPSKSDLKKLQQGVTIKTYKTKPATVTLIDEPKIWPRNPPIRTRIHIPAPWLEITIREGKNRQIRKMTASIGYPTLRLIRVAIGQWNLSDLKPGQSKYVLFDTARKN